MKCPSCNSVVHPFKRRAFYTSFGLAKETPCPSCNVLITPSKGTILAQMGGLFVLVITTPVVGYISTISDFKLIHPGWFLIPISIAFIVILISFLFPRMLLCDDKDVNS